MTKETASHRRPAYRRRKEERPDEILAAALHEFNERGFARASMARIAQSAGVSRATLYLYFVNKEALFLAVAEEAMAGFTQGASEKMEMGDHTTEDTLRTLFRQFYQTMTSTKNSALMRILISEGPAMPHLVEAYHSQILARGRTLLERIIARGIERNEIRPGPATQIPQILIAPAMFYAIHGMVFGALETLDEDAFAEAHIDVIMRGIGR